MCPCQWTHLGYYGMQLEYRAATSLQMVLAIALFRRGGLVVEEEATSVSHGRIDGHDGGDLPTGPEDVLGAADADAEEADGGTQVGGVVSLKVKGKDHCMPSNSY